MHSKEVCIKLSKPPYIYNDCENIRFYNLEKHFYRATLAQTEYKENLISSRQVLHLTPSEIEQLDFVLSTPIRLG